MSTCKKNADLWEVTLFLVKKITNGLKEHIASIYHYDGKPGTSKTLIRILLTARRHIPKDAVMLSYRHDNLSLKLCMFSEYSPYVDHVSFRIQRTIHY